MKIITSRTNNFVKKVFSLQNRKEREKLKIFWAEGIKAVDSALASDNFNICEIAIRAEAGSSRINELEKLAISKNIEVKKLDASCFDKISVLRHPEGIGAVIEMKNSKNARLPKTPEKPTVILWQLHNPGNQGAIIRSAAAFGVENIILIEPCVDEYHPMCVRATSGTFFNQKIIRRTEEDIEPWLENNAESVAALSPDGKEKIGSSKNLMRKILIIGNEPHGVEEEIKEKFATAVIPMELGVESLNTSCAAAIAMYEMFGSRANTKKK